jgi:hypothetical protein
MQTDRTEAVGWRRGCRHSAFWIANHERGSPLSPLVADISPSAVGFARSGPWPPMTHESTFLLAIMLSHLGYHP